MRLSKKILLIIFSGIIISLGVDVFVIEPNIIEVNEIEISSTGTEMKIGFISDFQRQNSDDAFVQRVVDILNAKNLDAVLIGGDFIDKSLKELPSLEPLKTLQTRYGVYAVLGNHDYNVYSISRNNPDLKHADAVVQYLQSDGTIQILENQNVMINDVAVVGLDSYWARLRDVDAALAGVDKKYTIMLAHNQNDLDIDKDVADLWLFGHTHCGQVRLPILGSVPKMIGFEGEYDYKQYEVNGADVYTTCGLTPGPRLLNPTEIVIISLVK